MVPNTLMGLLDSDQYICRLARISPLHPRQLGVCRTKQNIDILKQQGHIQCGTQNTNTSHFYESVSSKSRFGCFKERRKITLSQCTVWLSSGKAPLNSKLSPRALHLMDGIHSRRIWKFRGRISESFRLTYRVPAEDHAD